MLSDTIGEELVRLRKALGLTREQVAERCASWGWPAMTAAALGNIETGRRDAAGRRRREVTVDELVVLAWALEVPLPSLITPLDQRWTVELLPGHQVTTANALAWLRGDRSLSAKREHPIWPALRLYVKADHLAHELHDVLGQWGPQRTPAADDGEATGEVTVDERPSGWDEMVRSTIAVLRQDREQLRALGYTCPALPLGLEWIDPIDAEDRTPGEPVGGET